MYFGGNFANNLSYICSCQFSSWVLSNASTAAHCSYPRNRRLSWNIHVHRRLSKSKNPRMNVKIPKVTEVWKKTMWWKCREKMSSCVVSSALLFWNIFMMSPWFFVTIKASSNDADFSNVIRECVFLAASSSVTCSLSRTCTGSWSCEMLLSLKIIAIYRAAS